MLYRISRAFEYENFCDVEADSFEEAMKKVDNDDTLPWYEENGGEHYLAVEKWRCIDAEARKPNESEFDYRDRVDEKFYEDDWNVIMNVWDEDVLRRKL